MARYLLTYDYDDYFEEYIGEDSDGNAIFEDGWETHTDMIEVEAEDESDARTQGYIEIDQEDAYIWDVVPVEG